MDDLFRVRLNLSATPLVWGWPTIRCNGWMPQNLIWLVNGPTDTGSRDPSARSPCTHFNRRSRQQPRKPHGAAEGRRSKASLAHMPADASAFQCSMAVNTKPQPSPREHPNWSVPTWVRGRVMISPTWGFPPRRRQRWGESRLPRAVTRSTCLRGHGCHDRPEAEPRPRCPRPPRGMPPGRPRWPSAEPGPRSALPPALCWWALSGGLLPGFHGVERGTGKTPGRTDRLEAVGQTRAGRGGGTHRRDLRRPKGRTISVCLQRFQSGNGFPVRLRGMSSSGSPVALAFLERGIDGRRSPAHATARAGRSPAQLPRKSSGGSPAKAAGQPHACAPRRPLASAGLPANHPRRGENVDEPSSPSFSTGANNSNFVRQNQRRTTPAPPADHCRLRLQ